MDTPDINLLRDNVQAARLALDRAAAGRDYTLLAASKTQSAEVITLRWGACWFAWFKAVELSSVIDGELSVCCRTAFRLFLL